MIELPICVDELLEELKEKGVSLSLNGKKLRVEGKLSDDLKDRICEHKDGLIELVEMGEHRLRRVGHLALPDKARNEAQAEARTDRSWQDFYPDLEPEDFKIEELTSGISGRRIKEDVTGTTGFFIPWERLKKGPTGQVDDDRGWEFSELRIPSQAKAGFVDVWSFSRKRCPVGFRFRFLRCERAGAEAKR